MGWQGSRLRVRRIKVSPLCTSAFHPFSQFQRHTKGHISGPAQQKGPFTDRPVAIYIQEKPPQSQIRASAAAGTDVKDSVNEDVTVVAEVSGTFRAPISAVWTHNIFVICFDCCVVGRREGQRAAIAGASSGFRHQTLSATYIAANQCTAAGRRNRRRPTPAGTPSLGRDGGSFARDAVS